MRYAVVIEKGEMSYGAYVPDLPGCVAVGESLEEVKELIGEAIQFHLEGLREDGVPIPEPRSTLELCRGLRQSLLENLGFIDRPSSSISWVTE
jgi:predicted RNase H-like HicB family nuclease